MKIQDDRTAEQKKTHTLAVVARDSFMSGWGGATGGASRCAWAFNPEEVNSDRVFNWVKSRKEMKYVSLVNINKYRAPRGTVHFHIYVAGPDHSSAKF